MRNINTFFQWVIVFLIIFSAYSGELYGVEIVASDGEEGDLFGSSVAISGDYAIVGAPNDKVNDISSGSAYILKRNGDTWEQIQKLVADDAGSSFYFGFSVSISNDYAIIGAYGWQNYQGSAYIFKRTGATWSQIQKLVANDGQGLDKFGYSVSIFGNFCIVGTPYKKINSMYYGAMYIFKNSNNNWSQVYKYDGNNQNDYFGKAVAITEKYAIVGSPYIDNYNEGGGYLFIRDEDSWSGSSISSSDGNRYRQFGDSVSISNDYAIIGCGNNSKAYIFKYNGNSLAETQKITLSVYSVSISDEYAIIGGNNNAYIYKLDRNAWKEITKLGIQDENTCFGHSVSISNNTYIIGAFQKNNSQGAVYINKINQVRDCQLYGYVVDIYENPIEGMYVNSSKYGSAVTDNKGFYSLNGTCLPSDQLRLYDQINLTKGNVTYLNNSDWFWGKNTQNFTIQSHTISGYIKDSANAPIPGVTILFSNEGGETLTDENGFYRHIVYQGWNGKATPFGQGFQYEPFNISYSNITTNQTDQNYIGKKMNVSGYVFTKDRQPIANAEITFTNPIRTITTDPNGFYNMVLNYHWTGTVTPQKTGFSFQPETYDYYKIFTSRAYMNYTALEQTSDISGIITDETNQPLSNVQLCDNEFNCIQTDSNGTFTYVAGFEWTGYLKPVLEGYTFKPPYRYYENITQIQTNQHYKALTNKYLIAGRIIHQYTHTPLEGVKITCQTNDCETETDDNGQFKLEVPYGWSDTLSFQKTAYIFEPQELIFQRFKSDDLEKNIYFQKILFDISGTITDQNNHALSNVTVYFNNGGGIAVTDSSGFYSKKIPFGWSGIAEPFLMNSGFDPMSHEFDFVDSHQSLQNFKQTTDRPLVLIVTPDVKNVSSEQSTMNIDVLISPSSLSWTAQSLNNWIDVQKENKSLVVQITANPFETMREGTIIVKAENENEDSDIIQIIQSAKQPPLAITECEIFNENDYQYNQTITAIVKDSQTSDSETILGNPSDLLAAFVDNQCRGFASPIETEQGPRFFITIWNNSTDNENIQFKYFDSSLVKLYEKIRYPIQFKTDDHMGSIVDPLTLKLDILKQETRLYKNWNWISFHVVNPDMSLNNVLASITTNGMNMVSQNGYAEYLPSSTSWFGPLNQIQSNTMYMLKMKHAATLQFNGTSVITDNNGIMLHENWNWISYLPDFELDVNTALSSIENKGIQICGQEGYAEYLEDKGWYGQLKTLVPGCGYIIKMVSPGQLHYPVSPPDDPILSQNNLSRKRTRSASSFYFNASDYRFQETITVVVKENDSILGNTNDLLVAFSGDQCRGIAEPIDTPEGIRFFLQIWSNASETIQFKYFSYHENIIYPLDYSHIFQANQTIGSITEPQIMKKTNADDHPLSLFSVNASDFKYQGTITSEIIINGFESPQTGDKLAAFVNEDCRGVADVFDTPNGIRFFLQVYGNQSEEMTLAFYDASSETLYPLDNRILFTPNMSVGNITEPEQISLKTDTLPVANALQVFPSIVPKDGTISIEATISIEPSATKAYTLTAAEYYFDHDPGTGKGFPLNPSDDSFDSLQERLSMDKVNISFLSEGHHRIFVRGMRNDQKWGHTKSFDLLIDRTSPLILLNKSIHDKHVSWSWAAEDATSVMFRYTINDSPTWQSPSGEFTTQKMASENRIGKWFIHVQARDAAGNLSDIFSEEATVKTDLICKAAIMLAGGKASHQNLYWNVTKIVSTETYQCLKRIDYTDEMIHFMINSQIIDIDNDDIADNIVDTYTPTTESFLYTIKNRFVSELTPDDALLIYMFGHGTEDKRFQVLGLDNMLTTTVLNNALDDLQDQTGCKLVLVIESCYSGNFIEDLKDPSRVIVTSAGNEEYSIDATGRLSFSNFLFSQLEEGNSLEKSFQCTKDNLPTIASPQLSGTFASCVFLGKVVMAPKPEISEVTINQTLPENTQTVSISVKAFAGANPISQVFVQIVPPDAFLKNYHETVVYPEVSLVYDSYSNLYKGVLHNLYKPGIYKVATFAQDTEGVLSNAVVYSVNAPGIYVKGDLNYDRHINLDDVIMALMMVSNIQPGYDIGHKVGLRDVIEIFNSCLNHDASE
jgi:hypothetical protein